MAIIGLMTVEEVLLRTRPDLIEDEREEVLQYIAYMEDEFPLDQAEVLNYAQELFPIPTYH